MKKKDKKPIISPSNKCRRTRIKKSEAALSKYFHPKYALSDSCEKKCMDKKKYYLLPNGVKNKGFVIDTGCQRVFQSIQLKNTHNGKCNDRWVSHSGLCQE